MIAEATDHDTAMRFVLQFGGRRLRIPRRVREGSRIAVAVGREAAEKIVAALADEYIHVPIENRCLALWLHEQGTSKHEIANRLRMSPRALQYLFNDKVPRHPNTAERGA